MQLVYKAVTHEGKIIKGTIEAKDAKEAASFLREKSILPISIREQGESFSLGNIPFIKKSGASELTFFTRQLSSMLGSGLTLIQSLRIMKDQMRNPIMRRVILKIVADVEEGRTFSSSLLKHPFMFSPVYVAVVKAAESSGILDKVLLRLADNLEKQQKLRSLIKSAMIYPIIITIGMIIVVVIMMVFVIPQLAGLYKSLNVELPLPTKIILALSSFMVNFWFIAIPLPFVLFFGFSLWKKTVVGKILYDEFILKVPLVNTLVKQQMLTEFTRIFGLLIGTGAVVVESLTQAGGVLGNTVYQNAITGVTRRVEKGVPIADAFAAYPQFPTLLVEMTKIGEETGKLDESLLRISSYYENEVEQSVKNLTAAMEPLIMVILGIGVAFLVVSVILPIYTVLQGI